MIRKWEAWYWYSWLSKIKSLLSKISASQWSLRGRLIIESVPQETRPYLGPSMDNYLFHCNYTSNQPNPCFPYIYTQATITVFKDEKQLMSRLFLPWRFWYKSRCHSKILLFCLSFCLDIRSILSTAYFIVLAMLDSTQSDIFLALFVHNFTTGTKDNKGRSGAW